MLRSGGDRLSNRPTCGKRRQNWRRAFVVIFDSDKFWLRGDTIFVTGSDSVATRASGDTQCADDGWQADGAVGRAGGVIMRV